MIEYEEGIYKQDLATVEGEIKLAESDLSRCAGSRRLGAADVREGLRFDGARRSRKTWRSRRRGLRSSRRRARRRCWSTTPRTRRSRSSRARSRRRGSDELAKKATWELETSKEKKLEKQIAACKIKAPSDGLVVYANDPTRAFMSNTPQVEEGAQVRERQKIFCLPDISQMQVNTKVHESHIDKVQARHEGEDSGRRLLERAARRHGDRRGALARYRELFQLGHQGLHDQGQDRSPLPGLRAGHERRGDDPGDQLDKVLSVPVLAVLEFNGKDSCHQEDRTTGSCRPRSTLASRTRNSSRSRKA